MGPPCGKSVFHIGNQRKDLNPSKEISFYDPFFNLICENTLEKLQQNPGVILYSWTITGIWDPLWESGTPYRYLGPLTAIWDPLRQYGHPTNETTAFCVFVNFFCFYLYYNNQLMFLFYLRMYFLHQNFNILVCIW